MPLINRIIEVEIEGLDRVLSYPSLEIRFTGSFDEDPDPNFTTVEIYNLSKDTISSIDVNKLIILNAGYEGDVGNISSGVITKVETDTSGVDIKTKIKFQDASLNFQNARVSRTFRGPVKASTILRGILPESGLEIGEINLVNDITYQNGKTLFGKLISNVKKIASETGTDININSGRIDFLSPEAGLTTGFVLNSESGLINTPEKIDDKDTQSEYRITMLMNHNIRPRRIIRLESRDLEGLFFVVRGSYNSNFTIKAEIARLV